MLLVRDNLGIDDISKIINEIYDSGKIQEGLSISIAMSKSPGANEC